MSKEYIPISVIPQSITMETTVILQRSHKNPAEPAKQSKSKNGERETWDLGMGSVYVCELEYKSFLGEAGHCS